MLHTLRKAVASISVDLPAEDFQPRSAATVLSERLIELFQHSAFAATWAMDEPGASPWTERLLSDPLGHELALLGDASWAGPHVGRSHFAQQLARRTEAAAQAGLRLSTLALHGLDSSDLAPELDLLVKHRLNLVRGGWAERARGAAAGLRPQSVRFGIWRVPVATVLVGGASWWPRGAAWRARRAVRRVLAQAGFVHLVIDGRQMLAQQQTSLAGLQRLLHYIRQHELRGTLEVAPLQAASARWTRPRHMAPARSVLRHVA